MLPLNYDQKAIDDFLLIAKSSDPTSLLADAEAALQGMLILPGTGAKPIFVGDPPHWNENPTKDNEYIWILNRLGYMVTLCKAFLLTKERCYLDKVEGDLANWFETVTPPPIPYDTKTAQSHYHNPHGWRMLELGCRMNNTFPILLSVLRTYSDNKALIDRFYQCIEDHAERISNGSHLLWPNRDHNHYMSESIGLLVCASMLPDHPKSRAWRDQAIEGLEVACAAQLTDDGSQCEGAGIYHNAVAVSICQSIHYANRCGGRFSSAYIESVRNCLYFSVHTLTPSGELIPYGDASPNVSSPISAAILCYLIYGDSRPLTTLRRFVDSARIRFVLQASYPWGLDRIPELLDLLDAPLDDDPTALLPLVSNQRQMDQLIARSSWKKDAAMLYFSSHSPIDNGSNHAHMDQLGIVFSAYGKSLLQDPGRFTYVDGEDRHYYKSSQAHSLPTVDGRDAFEYISTWRYGPQKDGAITAIMDTDRIKGAFGYHENYFPTVVSRSVALIDGKFLLLADTFRNAIGEDLKVFFQLNSTSAVIEGTSVVTSDDGANIRILCTSSDRALQIDTMDGRLSDRDDHEYPIKRAVFSLRAKADMETLIFAAVPFADKTQDSLSGLSYADGVITFCYEGKDYVIRHENGLFSF